MVGFTIEPKSELDIYSLQIALLSYIAAKQKNSGLVFRVDDINLEENEQSNEQNIIEILKKFSIETEYKIYQSKNINIYQAMAIKLLNSGKAYACFCEDSSKSCYSNCINLTQNQISTLKSDAKEFTIRVQMPNKDIEISNQAFTPEQIGSFAILQKNGKPTKIFADSIDDMLSNIDILFTNQEPKESAKSIYILKLLDYNEAIEYHHIQAKPNRLTIKELFAFGFLPDAIINYILKPKDSEIFYLADIVENFDYKTIQNIDFNFESLKTFNRKHLLSYDSKKLSTIFEFADEDIGKLLKLYLNGNVASTINDLDLILKKIFEPKDCSSQMKELLGTVRGLPWTVHYEEFLFCLNNKVSFDTNEPTQLFESLFEYNGFLPDTQLAYLYTLPYLLEIAKCR